MSTVSRKTAPGLRQLLPLPLGRLARMKSDPLGFLLGGLHEFGDVFRFQLGPFVFHQVAHPDHVKHVLVDHQKNYPRSWFYDRAKVGAGEGLVTTEGPAWLRLRRLSQPAFQHHKIAALAAVMTEAVEAMRGRWHDHARRGEPLDVAAEFMRLTFRIAGQAFLSLDLGGEADRVGAAVLETLAYLEYRLSNLLSLPPFVPTPRALRFRRALRVLDGVVYDIIARRREPQVGPPDLLSLLLAARDEETGEGFTDRELRDQVLTFLVAGYETTAVALTWTCYLLSQHPEAADRVRAEAAAVLGGRTPTAADLPRLTYTRQVIEESLRLYPPVYGLVRDAREADEIAGFHIPARSMVVISPYVTHRHPEFWPDPEKFDPERFTPERAAGRPRLAWFPFLAGPHVCIGQEFALMEATLTVAMLAQTVRLRLVPGTVVELKPMLSLRPRGGLPMLVEAV
jgi:cytochrome P450